MNRPPCSKWRLWIGREIEGTEALGEPTLFIREALTTEIENAIINSGVKRLWFTVDNKDWKQIRYFINKRFSVSLEATPKTVNLIPEYVFKKVRIYFKISVVLKEGDFVCVGRSYQDEAFQISTGKKVSPEMYEEDIKIL